MNRPRLLRALRVTWTVFCGIACVLLIALWVRSYWWNDYITFSGEQSYCGLGSIKGGVDFATSIGPYNSVNDGWTARSIAFTYPSGEFDADVFAGFDLGYYPVTQGKLAIVTAPYWFAVLLMPLGAFIPWVPWWSKRYSLRTLLIATTLVAMVLGLIVYVERYRVCGN